MMRFACFVFFAAVPTSALLLMLSRADREGSSKVQSLLSNTRFRV